MKKIVCLIFLTSLILSTFIGCGQSNSKNLTESTTTIIVNSTTQAKKTEATTTAPSTTTPATTTPSTIAPTTKAPTTAPTAAPTTKAQTTAPIVIVPTNPVSQTVYITNTGEKYHRDGCRYLSKSKIAISLSDAKARGYTPCSVCSPPS